MVLPTSCPRMMALKWPDTTMSCRFPSIIDSTFLVSSMFRISAALPKPNQRTAAWQILSSLFSAFPRVRPPLSFYRSEQVRFHPPPCSWRGRSAVAEPPDLLTTAQSNLRQRRSCRPKERNKLESCKSQSITHGTGRPQLIRSTTQPTSPTLPTASPLSPGTPRSIRLLPANHHLLPRNPSPSPTLVPTSPPPASATTSWTPFETP